MSPHLVSIVGAGPGAADLLTVRAVRRLRRANVVIHDGLVPPAVVRLARSARHHLVSRRSGVVGPDPQAVVDLMVEAATRGERVVRLRAGDAFVLARGAEEALGLVRAGIPFEIVPGLTTASAAPTLGGIPLTHRGMTAAFLVASGHDVNVFAELTSGLRPGCATLVVLMGIKQRARIASSLLARGWLGETPAAIVSNASRRDQRVWRGTLRALSNHRDNARPADPGVIVIGPVAGVGAILAEAIRHPHRSGTRPSNTSSPSQEKSWQP